MAAPVTTATEWHWPADVLAFAAQHQDQPYLEPLLEATRRIFPDTRWRNVYVEGDPEIRDDWHIVFDVQVPERAVPDYVEAQHEWSRELFRWCPAPFVCIFRLCLDVVPS